MTGSAPRTRWGDIAILVAAGVIASFQIGKVPPAIPLLRVDIGLESSTIGWALSIFAAIGAIAGIAFGQLADRLGRRRMALVGLACIACASFAGAETTSVVMFLCTRVLEGFGFMSTAVAVPSLIAAASGSIADRRLALGLWSSYIPSGSAIVMLSAPWFLAHGGWRGMWIATSLAAVIVGLLCASRAHIAPPPTSVVKGNLIADVRAVLAAGYPVLAAVAFGAYAASYFILAGFLPAIMVASGRDIGSASLLSAIAVIANGLGNVSGGVATRYVARLPVMLVGASALAIGGAVVYLPAVDVPIKVLAATIAAFLGGMIPGTIMSVIPVLAPQTRLIATTQGLVVQCSSIGQLTGPVIVATLGAARGGVVGSTVMLGLGALGSLAALALARSPLARTR
jgi:cyanate permease